MRRGSPRRSRSQRSRERLYAAALFGLLGAVAAAACGTDGAGPAPELVIEREVFIDTYVDLRAAALRTDSQRIAEADRAEILARRGVTAQDLLDFVEAYSADLEYMRNLWNDVETRLDTASVGGA